MPILIQSPTAGQAFGPGWFAQWSSSFPFPPAAGSYWVVDLLTTEGTIASVGTWTIPTTSLGFNGPFASPVAGSTSLRTPIPGWGHGSPLDMRVQLYDPNNQLLDASDLNRVTYDLQSGVPSILEQQVILNSGGAQGGLTVEQARQLESVYAMSVLGIAPHLLWPLAQPLIESIVGRLSRDPGIDVSGVGDLVPPGPLPPVAGFGFDLLSVPPQVGTTLGNPTRYRRVVATFTVIKRFDSGDEYIESIAEFDVGAQYRRLTPTQLVRVQYAFPPGVFARFYWLRGSPAQPLSQP